MNIKKILVGTAAGVLMFGSLAVSAFAANTTVVVTPNNTQGWVFNPDPTTSTPYIFTTAKHSIGVGSLYVEPIGSILSDKFIAVKPLGTLVSDVHSIAYDFLIAGNGVASSAHQFYLNVYTNLPNSTTYYDCRFDYVPTTGSITSFTTATFNATDTPVNVGHHANVSCPSTLAGMVAGSTVSFIALNVGDTTNSDTGLAGYLDNVVINTASDVTTYDFEPTVGPPTTIYQCQNKGWKTFNNPPFRNQGECISYVRHHAHFVLGSVRYMAYGLLRTAQFTANTANDAGAFQYRDARHNWYRVIISSVKVVGHNGWFAGKVMQASNHAWVGQWLFAKVGDSTLHQIWGSFTSQALALADVSIMTNPTDGPFNTTGPLIVH